MIKVMSDGNYYRKTARSLEVQSRYDEARAALKLHYGDDVPCPFCNPANREVLSSSDFSYVTRNNFPYETFDGRKVKEHLMIVPVRHISKFSDFNHDEKSEYWQMLSDYHSAGYTSMTRSATDSGRSVPDHLHTHLLLYFTDSE